MDTEQARAQREAAGELGRRAVRNDPQAAERQRALERYLGLESRPPKRSAPPPAEEEVERAVASRRRRSAAERMREEAGSARDEVPRQPRRKG